MDPSFAGSGPFVQFALAPWTLPPTDARLPETPAREWTVAEQNETFEVCEEGLRLLCLAVIKQARLDARRKSYHLKAPALHFLQNTAPVWLRAMQIARRYGDDEAYRLIYDRPVLRELWDEDLDDLEEEDDGNG